MEFVLLKKLAKLEGTELWMFIGAIVAVAALIAVLAVLNKKHVNAAPTVEKKGKKLTTRMLVQGALCIALAFVLSYIKLFSMPMGGSVTLFSMLPIFVFAWMYGPAAGLLAGFAYSLLQVVQGAYVVHPVQFVLDYFLHGARPCGLLPQEPCPWRGRWRLVPHAVRRAQRGDILCRFRCGGGLRQRMGVFVHV